MKKIVCVISLAFVATTAQSGPSIVVDPQTGKYLGTLSNNQYDPDSVSNPYGRYGSEYSSDSINNPYGKYGSPYGTDSANNPYATNPPKIINYESTRRIKTP